VHFRNASLAVYVSGDVAAVCDLYEGLVGADAQQRTGAEQLRVLAARLADGHRRRRRGAFVEIVNWHPELTGHPESEIWAAGLADEDYLDTVARGHGYPGWEAVSTTRPGPLTLHFERCLDDVLAGAAEAVAVSLLAYPDLATIRSHWGHRATLLHYLAANGVEIYRQRVPRNAADLARLLLDNGADANAKANMYGGERGTLGMLLSSAHPAHAGVTAELADVLRQAGATSG
jgi:hypothetical protein